MEYTQKRNTHEQSVAQIINKATSNGSEDQAVK